MWSRLLAGVLPGFFVAAGLVGLVCWAWPGPWQATLVPGLVAFFPVWMCVIGTTFFHASGKRAWAWNTACALALFGGLYLLQWLGWVG